MNWTADFLAWLRSWITPKRPPVKPARSLAELEAAFAMAKKRHQARSHIEAAMRQLRIDGLRKELGGSR